MLIGVDNYTLLPLKFKYRDPANMPVVKNGQYKARCNAAKGTVSNQGKGHRRRSYLTHIQEDFKRVVKK